MRELRNLVERAVLLCEGELLQPADFDSLHTARQKASTTNGGFALPAEGVNLEEVERSLVVQALERAGGNQTRAAALLGFTAIRSAIASKNSGSRKPTPNSHRGATLMH